MKIPKLPGRGKITVLAVAVALILAAAPAALAANGGNFILGQQNVATAISKLVGKVAGPSLLINNTSEDPKATALQLNVKAGKPPMKVNSDKKVPKLNADKLDNLDQSAFLRKNGKATDSDKLDGKDSTEFYAAGSKVADSAHADQADNADKLDGIDSSELTRAPRIKDTVGSYSADFSSLGPTTVCKGSSDYAPPRPQHAIIHIRTDAKPSGSSLTYGLRGAYSTNGGSTWSETAPSWYVESSANLGESAVNTYTGHLDLNAGSSYRFGANVYRTAGSGTIVGGFCAVTVEIVDRNPSASTFSAEKVGGQEQP